jgi:hypothetical protein
MMKSKQLSSKSGMKVPGGRGHMAGKSGAAAAEAGKVSSGGRAGNNSFKPDKGRGKMAGFSGSKPARSC